MISIKCIRGPGDKEAPKIQDDLITTEHLAVLRGTACLDEVFYNRTYRTIRTPYADILDGQVAKVVDPQIATGNYLLRRVEISIEQQGKIAMILEMEGEHEDPA